MFRKQIAQYILGGEVVCGAIVVTCPVMKINKREKHYSQTYYSDASLFITRESFALIISMTTLQCSGVMLNQNVGPDLTLKISLN